MQSVGSPDVFAGGEDARLGKNSKFTSDRPAKKVKRSASEQYYIQSRMAAAVRHGELPKHPVRTCSRIPIPTKGGGEKKSVQIHSYTQGEGQEGTRKGYVNLFRCASPLVCPVCGEFIRKRRAEEIRHAGRRMLEEGYTFVFVALTAAHGVFGPSLYDFVRRFNAAHVDLKSGGAWQNMARQWAIRHSIRTVETTDDTPESKQRSGFHYHAHIVMFLERAPLTGSEKKLFEGKLKAMWLHALHGVGLSASMEHGCEVEIPRTRAGAVDKAESMKRLAAYVTKNVAWEMTGADTKVGRKAKRMSIWALQRLAVTSHPELLPRYGQYMRAVKGISFMQWTPGLKAFVGLPELADEELLRGRQGELVCSLSSDDLAAVARQGGQRKLLEAAEAGGLEGIRAGLKAAHAGCDILTGEAWKPPWKEKPPGGEP